MRGKASSFGLQAAGEAKRKTGAWLMTETLIAMSILGMMIAAMAYTQGQANELSRCELVREHCTAAAQAQLDSYTASGKGLSADECKRLWPGVTLEVDVSPGKGDWEGLSLVSVKAAGNGGAAAASAKASGSNVASAGGRAITVQLSRYVAAKEPR